MSAADRLERIQRRSAARKVLIRVLGRAFTHEELGLLFDQLPDTPVQPLTTLAEAVGQAWADTRPAETKEADL